MTLDELLAREGIRDTLATYNQSGDRLKIEGFLSVFTEDAVLETDAFRNEGKAAIRAWISGWGGDASAGPAETRRKASFVRHHLTTCKIELTGPDTAKVRTYWAVYTDIGPDHCGYYLDDFRKVGDRWLIAHRRARTDWMAPDSLFRIVEQHAQG